MGYKTYSNPDIYKCRIAKGYFYLAFREWWGTWTSIKWEKQQNFCIGITKESQIYQRKFGRHYVFNGNIVYTKTILAFVLVAILLKPYLKFFPIQLLSSWFSSPATCHINILLSPVLSIFYLFFSLFNVGLFPIKCKLHDKKK